MDRITMADEMIDAPDPTPDTCPTCHGTKGDRRPWAWPATCPDSFHDAHADFDANPEKYAYDTPPADEPRRDCHHWSDHRQACVLGHKCHACPLPGHEATQGGYPEYLIHAVESMTFEQVVHEVRSHPEDLADGLMRLCKAYSDLKGLAAYRKHVLDAVLFDLRRKPPGFRRGILHAIEGTMSRWAEKEAGEG